MAEHFPFVAIVDDEEPIRKALGRLLRAANLETEAFASGPAFLDSLAVRRPDCVILDLHMPGMTGLHVLRRLRQSGVQVPAIVITAHDEPETRADCLAAGATAYLRKPLEDRLLLDAVASAAKIRKNGTR
ncbi:MAG TPA: response regulator [Burkholderiales bacterium]|jgi:FixJ family two-component response regulator|nr:response regulator [Burkholderiales bacterium]